MFDKLDGTKDVLKAAETMAQHEGPPILVISGGHGTGKTHLLEAIGREWIHAGRSVRYDYVPDLLDELRATYSLGREDTVHDARQRRANVGLLLLDDLGQGTASEWVAEQLTAVVDERYRTETHLVVATNYSRDQIASRVTPRLASRLWDHSDAVLMVSLSCPDYRTRRR